jgi:hypothetical protein
MNSRRLSDTPQPGSKPVKVSREVPVTIISRADGTREVVETETAEPCYGCKCCVLWAATVETLRASMLEHEQGQHKRQTLPGCLVCQLLAGAADE